MMKGWLLMRIFFVLFGLLILSPRFADATEPAVTGVASWYGESHRGKLMANGKKFDPDKLTAASWFYPLGTRVKVTLVSAHDSIRPGVPLSVIVTITDRGPAKRLVREGRIIDLAQAAFQRLAPVKLGLIPIQVSPVP